MTKETETKILKFFFELIVNVIGTFYSIIVAFTNPYGLNDFLVNFNYIKDQAWKDILDEIEEREETEE